MTEEQRVKRNYPKAYCSQLFDDDEPPVVIGYAVYDDGGAGKRLGPVANTAMQAWAGASRQMGNEFVDEIGPLPDEEQP